MDDQVAEIKAKIDIAEIIGERIELKKAGRNFKASCPFHGEKTASFMVSPELQIFKCFGCSEGGDVYSFLEKYEGMEFPEALKYLADRAGVTLKRQNFGAASEKEKLIDIHREALRFYNYMLLSNPQGARALEYLQKERGLTKEIIEEFQLGYSPENSLLISKFLVEKKKFITRDLETAGLGIAKGSSIYDRFRGRVIFPLFDHRGNPVAFAGRILPWVNQEMAKYINSPESPIYHKSNVLFGLNITRSLIKKKKIAIVVEGELDAISSYQAGIKNVVAIKGSALTENQVRLLSRFAQKFILTLDSDMAGDAASRRGIAIASNLGVEVKVARLTKFKDPDEAARGDIENYKKDLIHAEGVWDFLIDSVFSRFDSETGMGKANISKELTPIISEIEDKIVQAHYINLIARKLGVREEAVFEQIIKSEKQQEAPKIVSVEKVETVKDRRFLLEERLVTMAFQIDPKVLLTGSVRALIKSPFNNKLIEMFEKWLETKKPYNVSEFGKSLPPELFDGFVKMVMEDGQEASENPDVFKKELDLVKKELKILEVKVSLKDLAAEMRNLEIAGEKEKLLKAQNKFNKLAKTLSGYEDGDDSSIILNEG